jgi:hypothetical protein
MAGVLRWEDPPSRTRRQPANEDWYLIAAQLRGKPGEWGVVTETATTAVPVQIRQGSMLAFRPAGSFESKGFRVNGIYTVYARYIGEAS